MFKVSPMRYSEITAFSTGFPFKRSVTLPLMDISLLPTAPTSEQRSHHLQPESSHSFSNACEVSLPDIDLGEHLEASPVFDTHQPFTKSKG